MNTHVRIPCPSCGRELKVRAEYLGHTVGCKHCDSSFKAEAPAGAVARPGASAELGPLDPRLLGEIGGRESETSADREAVVEWPATAPPPPGPGPVLGRSATMAAADAGLARALEVEKFRSDELLLELAEAQAGSRELRKQVDRLRAELEGREAAAAREIERLEAELAGLAGEREVALASSEAERRSLAEQADRARAETRAAEAARGESQGEIDRERDRSSRQLAELRQEAEAARRGRDDALARLDAQSGENERLAGRLEETLVANRDLADSSGRLAGELRERVRSLHDELAEERARAAAEADGYRRELAAIGSELADVRSESEADRAAHEGGLASLRAELRSAIERGDRLEREAGAAAGAAARADAELATARQLAAGAESKLARAQRAEAQMRSLLRELGIHSD